MEKNNPGSRELPGPRFRNFQGTDDLPLVRSLVIASTQADGIPDKPSPEDIEAWCAPAPRFDPEKNILFVLKADGTAVGFNRVGWYTGAERTQLLYHDSYLLPEGRAAGYWPPLIRQGEQRLRAIAASLPPAASRFFQGWATAVQVALISALEKEGYQAVRRFSNMQHRFEAIPDWKLAAGLEIRPVQPEHMRSIWEARCALEAEVFETVAEKWTQERYQPWLEDPSHTPEHWQVAWEGDQLVGMVLNRIDEEENRRTGVKRGYTEHIFIHESWRRRGLIITLLSRSLHLLRDLGMQEAVLGVDMQNASRAYEFYQKMGFQTFSTDLWYRKPMD